MNHPDCGRGEVYLRRLRFAHLQQETQPDQRQYLVCSRLETQRSSLDPIRGRVIGKSRLAAGWQSRTCTGAVHFRHLP